MSTMADKEQDQQQGNEQDQEQDSKNQNMGEFILSNNLILCAILKHLDVATVKNVRLVCKNLHDNATQVLGYKTRLDISKMLNDPTPPIFQVHHNLVRNIQIEFENYNEPTTMTDGLRLISFFYEQHTFVQDLHYDTSSEILLLFTILNIFTFPTLQNIKINFKQDFANYTQRRAIIIPPQAVTIFQARQNISHVNICCKFYDLIDAGRAIRSAEIDPGLKSCLQNLLNSAPNLNSFDFTFFNFYPDLSQCKNIKKAHLRIFIAHTTLDICKFNATLNQMALTLQELKLECPRIRGGLAGNLLFGTNCLPCYPKLEKLTLLIKQPWTFIQPTEFPVLKHLAMNGINTETMDKCILSLGRVMRTVRSFTMIKRGVYQSWSDESEYGLLLPEKLEQSFPNVVEIIYTNQQQRIQTFCNYMNFLEGLLKICDERNFDKLAVIGFKRVYRVDYQVAEVKYQKDTKLIEWRCQELLEIDEGCLAGMGAKPEEIFMRILLATKTMKSVVFDKVFLGLNEEMWTRIGTFVKELGLPVHLH